MDSKSKSANRISYFVKNDYPEGRLPFFIDDLRTYDNIPYIHFPDEYDGQSRVKLVCTQHWNSFYRPDITPYKQKKITQAWVDFLQTEKLPIKDVQLCSRTSQKVFDALCMQENIEFLRFKWCAVTDLSAIRNLKNLKKLYIGMGSSVTDISPLADLKNLEALCLDSTIKVTDYSPLESLSNLVALDIGGNFQNRAVIDMESDEFLFGLKKLEFLHLPSVKILKRKFLFEKNVMTFKYACFRN